jgi:hypothetical protein
MQKLFHHLGRVIPWRYYNSSIWLYRQDLWISLRYTCRAYNYTSKLMIYGFFNFFCVSEGGPPESRARKG